jgi:predicted enzyme related to lactoylglutathione lyase
VGWTIKEGDWCHVEIPVKDLQAQRRFYEGIFGWEFSEIPGVEGMLEIKTSEDGIRSSLGTLAQDETPVPFVKVEGDMAAKVEEIQTAGGSVIKEATEIMPGYWYAYVRDPEGNLFGLWKD